MATDDSLIRYKTDAWKGGGMVAGYAERMHENRGTNRLKNRVEVSLCRDYITGKKIVDVGIGTGRGSLPLAREGHVVTGIDISQAMLDQCRREAGATPIELIAGDLTKLPLGDEQFDSLISLNVAVHFPNWREALVDWARVVKPGGRLVFDVHSRDHLNAVGGAYGVPPDELLTPAQRDNPDQFMLRVTANEVAQAAQATGLSVVALVPYAALLGGGNVNYWLGDSRLTGYLGDRALSWMAVDEPLFAFGCFIEQELVANLSTSTTGRFMIVLEKTPDPQRTADTIARHAAIDAIFARSGSFQELCDAVGPAATHWRSALAAHLGYERNRVLLAMTLTSPAAEHLRDLIAGACDADTAAALFDGRARRIADDMVTTAIANILRGAGDATVFRGVDIGPTLEYDLMRDLLGATYFGAKATR